MRIKTARKLRERETTGEENLKWERENEIRKERESEYNREKMHFNAIYKFKQITTW